MAYTDTWNAAFEALPADGDLVSAGADRIRDLKLAIRERLAKDHYMEVAGTDADHGEHSKITFQAQSAKPAAVANKGFLYTKDVSAKVELFWEDEDGDEVQLTSGGALNLSAASITTVLSTAYPVGSIYVSTLATNPGTLLGFGTWTAFGAGKTLVGLNAAETEFDTVEETGGEKTHTLTEAEMPVHHHHYVVDYNRGGSSSNAFTHGDASGSNLDPATTTAGSGGAHNNLQPYIVVYMWKRTA